MNRYKIAGLGVEVESNDRYYYDICREYITEDTHVDISIAMCAVDTLDIVGDVEIHDEHKCVTRDGDVMRAYYYDNGAMYGGIWWSPRYVTCGASIVRGAHVGTMDEHEIGYLFMGMLYGYALTYHGGIALHGSAIDYKGNAIIFTAPSGTGKSTQARLWQSAFPHDVTFINDDKPACRMVDGVLYCYGTPFSGSDHVNANRAVPVGAIVRVERAEEDYIERLGMRESVVLLLEEMPRAGLNREVNANSMKNISHFLEATPVYRLYCTPTEHAVEVAYEMLGRIYEEKNY